MNSRPQIIPFRVGGAIRDPASFAGRKETIDHIAVAMSHLQNVSLHGERRTGKTSLLLHLAHPEVDIGLPEMHIPVYFDFQPFTDAHVASVWQAIANAIGEQIRQRHPNRKADADQFLANTAGPGLFGTRLGRALSQLDDLGFKIHLLFDEFDQTGRNFNLGDAFYDTLRSLPTRAENVSYVIATRTGLVTLQPTYSKVSSPFFNIFSDLILHPFNEDEVYKLVFDYFARAQLDLSLAGRLCAESTFLYDVTGYHPFFLQSLCYHLCARLDEPDWPLAQAQEEALRAFKQDAEPHFEFYWMISSPEERDLIETLASRQSIDWSQQRHVAKSLEDRCLVVRADSDWRLFSSAFAGWVKERRRAA